MFNLFSKMKERKEKEILLKELERKLNSLTPYFEIQADVSEEAPLEERYFWNKAFVEKLRDDGIKGKYDAEVVSRWLTQQEDIRREKALAEHKALKKASDEPWVEVVGDQIDADNNIRLSLDWNKPFVNFLRRHGFTGATDIDIVEAWLLALNSEITEESKFDG